MKQRGERGVTLVEIVVVVLLIGLLMSFGGGKFSSLMGWRQKGEVRKLAATWELLFREARSRSQAYLLVLDLDRERYTVRRLLTPEGGNSGGKDGERRGKSTLTSEQQTGLKGREKGFKLAFSLNDEFKFEDNMGEGALEESFYDSIFSDPSQDALLGRPLEFPSLAEDISLGAGVLFDSVELFGKTVSTGTVAIRLFPSGYSDTAAVYLKIGDEFRTLTVNPLSGEVKIRMGKEPAS